MIVGDQLTFEDLGVRHGYVSTRTYTLQWSQFDNDTNRHRLVGVPLPSAAIPPITRDAEVGSYFAARVVADDSSKAVDVYLRRERDELSIVGIDRQWPGKLLADEETEQDAGSNRYTDLDPAQQQLFYGYARGYNEAMGTSIAPQEYFNTLSISKRTTYDAVTHALMSSALTDEGGNALGSALDLVTGIERIAGQYYGRSGDEQFRLYAFLSSKAVATLEASQEFFRDKENTVYHVGYPTSYRQTGNVPNIQFSVSEDGTKADIDVDYRSSKMPAAMFNGHLTSGNSDVRAGNNHERHDGRWSDFIAWWQELFGKLGGEKGDAGRDLISREAWEPPTPLPPNRPAGAELTAQLSSARKRLPRWKHRRSFFETKRTPSTTSAIPRAIGRRATSPTYSSPSRRTERRQTSTWTTAPARCPPPCSTVT